MVVELTVHFGNSNYFNMRVVDKVTFAKLAEIFTYITNVPMSDVLYMICGNHVIDALGDGSPYSFTSYLQDIPLLDIQNNKLTIHVIVKNKNITEDKFDLIVNNRLIKASKKIPRTRTTSITRGVDLPELIELYTGGRGAEAMFATALIENISYDQATALTNVPVVLTDSSFNRLTITRDRGLYDESLLTDECFCGSTVAENSETITELPCSHLFHTECIKHHLLNSNTRCPVCNGDVRDSR
jgi:hypothetical protein